MQEGSPEGSDPEGSADPEGSDMESADPEESDSEGSDPEESATEANDVSMDENFDEKMIGNFGRKYVLFPFSRHRYFFVTEKNNSYATQEPSMRRSQKDGAVILPQKVQCEWLVLLPVKQKKLHQNVRLLFSKN